MEASLLLAGNCCISGFSSQALIMSLYRLVPVGVNTRRMQPISFCHSPVLLLFISRMLSFLMEVFCQFMMTLRGIRGIKQVDHLLTGQMYCWVCCSWA